MGTVTELTDPYVYGTATVSVDFYLKAAGGPAQVEIGVFGSPSLCMSPVEVGGYAIFFAEGDPFSGSLNAHYSPWRDAAGEITPYRGQFNATASATAENVQIVADVAGQDPVLPGLAAATITVTLVLAELPTPAAPPAAKALPDERALADEDEEGSGGFCAAPTAGGGRTDLGLLGLLAGIAAFGLIRRVR